MSLHYALKIDKKTSQKQIKYLAKMLELSRHTVIIHPATAEEGQEKARVFVSSEVQSLRQSEAEERLIIASVLGHFFSNLGQSL